ncbi:MAG: hypothetical protein ACE10D_13280, partial [Planctomycetota bacterium]
ANSYFREALQSHPRSVPILAALVQASGDHDADWPLLLHRLAAAAADETGAFNLGRTTRRNLGKDRRTLVAVERARAQALLELYGAREALSGPGSVALARAYADIQAELAAASETHSAGVDEGAPPESFVPPSAPVTAALAALCTRLLEEGKAQEAFDAAACLRGLAAQAAFQHLKGTVPDLAAEGALAAGVMHRARRRLLGKPPAPVQRPPPPREVEQEEEDEEGCSEMLEGDEDLPPEHEDQEIRDPEPDFDPTGAAERAITDEHRRMSKPAVAFSPRGYYRVETSCGAQTLKTVVEQIEQHHARLVRWYGKDPFLECSGIVRVVPDFADIESEGQPYHWARGFQRGDTTVVRFAVSGKLELARLLTHELTHRFDRRLYPAMPSWLAEGRAVYTAAAFHLPADKEFLELAMDWERVRGARNTFYGTPEKLIRLLRDEPRDYRDNYTAGHALWIYLTTWRPGARKAFAPQIPKWLNSMKLPGKDPYVAFKHFFMDGKGGRPNTLRRFASGFKTFLNGFFLEEPPAWTKRYIRNWTPRGSFVYDAPTWPYSKRRSEPFFGQRHAARAADILWRHDDPAALEAHEWALHVDGDSPERLIMLERLLQIRNLPAGVWAVRRILHRYGEAEATDNGAPSAIVGERSAFQRYLKALRGAAAYWRKRDFADAADAVERSALRLQRSAGLPAATPGAIPARMLRPQVHSPAAWGWKEDTLVGYDQWRAIGLWHETPEGDLVVGSTKGSSVSEARSLRIHHCFVRGRRPLSGAYALRTRVHLLRPYVQGALVLGRTRRDRHVRLEFEAGDEHYAAGRGKERAPLGYVRVRLSTLSEREQVLPGFGDWVQVPTDGKHPDSFEVLLLVDGPQVHAFVERAHVLSHYDLRARDIAGHYGFAVEIGSFRVGDAQVTEFPAGAPEQVGAAPWPQPYSAARLPLPAQVLHRPIEGVPLHTEGTLMIWFPGPVDLNVERADFLLRAHRTWFENAAKSRTVRSAAQVMIVVPEAWPEVEREWYKKRAQAACRSVQLRAVGKDVDGAPDYPLFVFVDPLGVVRASAGGGQWQWRGAPWFRAYRGW